MNRRSGVKPTTKFSLSEHFIECLRGEPEVIAAYVDAITWVARNKSHRVRQHTALGFTDGDKRVFARMVKLGAFEVLNEDEVLVHEMLLTSHRRMFWVADAKKRGKKLDIKKRFKVLQRDGFRCVYCGSTPDKSLLHVDHVTPRSAGGGNDIGNLVTSCRDCNLGKGARQIEEPLQ